jgi:hypothetical protein
LRETSERIRGHGLKPALWWSPAMGRLNRLVGEHLEWCCLDDRGESWSMDSGEYRKAALDFSVPEARDFIALMLETIFRSWGFAGMKLDFWSYPFECKDIRFRHGHAVEWRNWFLKTIGGYISNEGLFQICGGAPLGIAAGADYPCWLLQELAGRKPQIAFDGFRHGLCMLRYDWSAFVPLDEDLRPKLAAPLRTYPAFE